MKRKTTKGKGLRLAPLNVDDIDGMCLTCVKRLGYRYIAVMIGSSDESGMYFAVRDRRDLKDN